MEKQNVRESIINTASQLFCKQGYANTGINQIIAEAGVAKSTLYEYFKTKEDLLIAYLKETGPVALNALTEASKKGNGPSGQILAVFQHVEDLNAQRGFSGCHFFNILFEMPGCGERATIEIKMQRDAMRLLFSQILKPVHQAELSDQLYTLFEGALMAYKVHHDAWPFKSARRIIQKLL